MRHITSPEPLRIRQVVKNGRRHMDTSNRRMVPGKARKDPESGRQYQTRVTEPVVLAYGCRFLSTLINSAYDAVARPQTTGGLGSKQEMKRVTELKIIASDMTGIAVLIQRGSLPAPRSEYDTSSKT